MKMQQMKTLTQIASQDDGVISMLIVNIVSILVKLLESPRSNSTLHTTKKVVVLFEELDGGISAGMLKPSQFLLLANLRRAYGHKSLINIKDQLSEFYEIIP